MVQVVPLRYDTAFKKAFSQPTIFCQFVHDVLRVDIQIEKVHQGYRYLKPVGQVDIEYDLFAEDETTRMVVEIQHVKERDFFDRFLYYHLISLVEQVKSSRNYQIDKTVYTVVVLTSPSLDTGIDCSVLMGDISFVTRMLLIGRNPWFKEVSGGNAPTQLRSICSGFILKAMKKFTQYAIRITSYTSIAPPNSRSIVIIPLAAKFRTTPVIACRAVSAICNCFGVS
ncbi:PD-(D/E)XK nuclease family transposase [Candidatus Poribacteria bacterium]|nr:PD-(D/E)XK nuclease family transposase [Candidatus Poribacteria bacterium]